MIKQNSINPIPALVSYIQQKKIPNLREVVAKQIDGRTSAATEGEPAQYIALSLVNSLSNIIDDLHLHSSQRDSGMYRTGDSWQDLSSKARSDFRKISSKFLRNISLFVRQLKTWTKHNPPTS